MEVDIDRVAVLATSEEEAKHLFAFLDSLGYRWASGFSLRVNDTRWNMHNVNSTYAIYKSKGFGDRNRVCVGTLEYCQRVHNDFHLFYSVDDFMSKYDARCQPISLDIGDVL